MPGSSLAPGPWLHNSGPAGDLESPTSDCQAAVRSIMDNGKWGVCIGGPYAEGVQLRVDASPISWMYNYNTNPGTYIWGDFVAQSSNDVVGWLNTWHIEYVPMVSDRSFHPLSGPTDSRGLCWLVTDSTPVDFANRVRCSVTQMVEQLLDMKSRLRVPVRYLMATNEPWGMDPFLSAEEAAEIWRHYLQPAASGAGLLLISPSVGIAHVTWLAEFITACYDRRDQKPPCDITTLAAFAVHEYDCKESFWRLQYEQHGFRARAAAELDKRGRSDAAFWNAFLSTRRFWVTETNCNWEYDDGRNKWADPPDGIESCRRLSGQRPHTHGHGSITTINELQDVAAYAWWTISSNSAEPGTRHYNSQMANEEGCLLGPGLALYLINAGSPVSCTSAASACPIPPPSPAPAHPHQLPFLPSSRSPAPACLSLAPPPQSPHGRPMPLPPTPPPLVPSPQSPAPACLPLAPPPQSPCGRPVPLPPTPPPFVPPLLEPGLTFVPPPLEPGLMITLSNHLEVVVGGLAVGVALGLIGCRWVLAHHARSHQKRSVRSASRVKISGTATKRRMCATKAQRKPSRRHRERHAPLSTEEDVCVFELPTTGKANPNQTAALDSLATHRAAPNFPHSEHEDVEMYDGEIGERRSRIRL